MLDDTEHVSDTPLIVVVTVCPSSAPDVWTVMVLSALSSAALRCDPHAAETLDIVGCVLSIVMADPEVRDVTADATALPAKSENVHENPTVPSWSASSTVTAAVWWSVPSTVAYVTEVSAIAPEPSVQVQVGAAIASDGSIVSVTTSPWLALPVPLTAMVTAEAVGTVAS